VATTMRTRPCSAIARRILAAACPAAARLSEALSSNTFTITRSPKCGEIPMLPATDSTRIIGNAYASVKID
jgi:hypothetical protein